MGNPFGHPYKIVFMSAPLKNSTPCKLWEGIVQWFGLQHVTEKETETEMIVALLKELLKNGNRIYRLLYY